MTPNEEKLAQSELSQQNRQSAGGAEMTPNKKKLAQKVATDCLRAAATYAVIVTVGFFYQNQRGLLVMVCFDLAHVAIATALNRWTLAKDATGATTGRSWFGTILHAVFFVAGVAAAIFAAVESK